MEKAKRQAGMCEFEIPIHVRPSDGYAANLSERDDTRQCGRPAVVQRGGKNLCGRHDSELSAWDIAEIEAMVTDEDRQRLVQERRDFQVRERWEQDAIEEEQAYEAAQARRVARQRELRLRRTNQCPQCGRVRSLSVSRGICYSCIARDTQARMDQERLAEAEQREAFARQWAVELRVRMGQSTVEEKPKPEPDSKSLAEQVTGKRLILRDENG
jgi:hypothetical protein